MKEIDAAHLFLKKFTTGQQSPKTPRKWSIKEAEVLQESRILMRPFSLQYKETNGLLILLFTFKYTVFLLFSSANQGQIKLFIEVEKSLLIMRDL